MELINESSFPAAWLVGKISPPQWSMTCLVKGTFQLRNGEAAVFAEEQADLTGDEHVGKDLNKLLRYPSDFTYFKPYADVMLMGTCYAPIGEPVTAVPVQLRIGGCEKSLIVVGDRTREVFCNPSDPQSFQTMPLTYKYTYGGSGFAQNPLGKGHQEVTTPDGHVLYTLPNIEYPDTYPVYLAKGAALSRPAGFGPICQTWPQRIGKIGSYSDKWLKERWPWFPEDIDWSFFNAAPEDQQLTGYLNGNEVITAINMHSMHAHYQSHLPGIRVRCFLQERVRADLNFREVPMNLDTLWIDMDQEKLIIVWRGNAAVRTENLDEIDYFFVVSEPLNQPAKPLDYYRDALILALIRREEEDEEFEPEEEELDLMEEEIEEEEVEESLEKVGLSPIMVAPGQQQEAGSDATGIKDNPSPDVTHESSLVAESESNTGVDEFDVTEPPEEHVNELTMEQLMVRIQRKESLEDAELSDLDLTGVDLSHMNLRNAIIERVVLRKANLACADLTGAMLANLNLQETNCQGTIFSEADLSEAQLIRSDLSGAILRDTDLMRADLREACLVSVEAQGADFSDADLSRATFEGANLTGADLSACRLHRTNLSRANLTDASLERAWGVNIQAEEAKVDMLKAAGANFCEGNFKRVSGKETVWEEGVYWGSDFSGSDLKGAEFSSSYLGWTKFNATDLTEAVFDEACLVYADFVRTKLFNTSVQKADLSHTKFFESNLYEANLCFALTNGTKFEGSNMRMLKHTMDK
jgi:uncharacterized protein YjbI with pentapeptide repeats